MALEKKDEERLLEFEIIKQAEGRKIRSTKVFYDESYWGDFWVKRFNAQVDEKDPVTKNEVDKKVDFIRKYFPDAKSTLDVGCSFGFLTARLHDLKFEAWGVDLSKPAVDKSPERIRSHILPISAMNLDQAFPEDRFDLVTVFDVLEHLYIEEIYDVVAQVTRVAKQNILIRVPEPGYHAEPWVADLGYKGCTRDHVSTYPWEFWARRFTENGKFRFWMEQHWNIEADKVSSWKEGELTEGWLCFRR